MGTRKKDEREAPTLPAETGNTNVPMYYESMGNMARTGIPADGGSVSPAADANYYDAMRGLAMRGAGPPEGALGSSPAPARTGTPLVSLPSQANRESVVAQNQELLRRARAGEQVSGLLERLGANPTLNALGNTIATGLGGTARGIGNAVSGAADAYTGFIRDSVARPFYETVQHGVLGVPRPPNILPAQRPAGADTLPSDGQTTQATSADVQGPPTPPLGVGGGDAQLPAQVSPSAAPSEIDPRVAESLSRGVPLYTNRSEYDGVPGATMLQPMRGAAGDIVRNAARNVLPSGYGGGVGSTADFVNSILGSGGGAARQRSEQPVGGSTGELLRQLGMDNRTLDLLTKAGGRVSFRGGHTGNPYISSIDFGNASGLASAGVSAENNRRSTSSTNRGQDLNFIGSTLDRGERASTASLKGQAEALQTSREADTDFINQALEKSIVGELGEERFDQTEFDKILSAQRSAAGPSTLPDDEGFGAGVILKDDKNNDLSPELSKKVLELRARKAAKQKALGLGLQLEDEE